MPSFAGKIGPLQISIASLPKSSMPWLVSKRPVTVCSEASYLIA